MFCLLKRLLDSKGLVGIGMVVRKSARIDTDKEVGNM